jgi:hypothetical protein
LAFEPIITSPTNYKIITILTTQDIITCFA